MGEVARLRFSPCIERLVTELFQEDIGLCAGKLTLKDVSSSSDSSKDVAEENDTFTLCIPYAGSTLQWQVLLNASNEEELPDFFIPEYDGFDPDYQDIPTLVEWNTTPNRCLAGVIKDLLMLYKEHHLKLLDVNDEEISKQVRDVISMADHPYVDIHVLKDEDQRYGTHRYTASILIQVPIDFTEIPDICFKDAPAEDPHFPHPVLLIRASANGGKISPLLYMPPRMEHVLGGRNAMKLPSYNRQTTILSEYISSVKRNIQSVITILKEGHSKRREYVAAFLYQCASNVLEYDAEDFSKISLLLMHEDFYFIVHVSLGGLFPQEQPKLTFQSVYHVTRRGALYQVAHTAYPYSPRWSGSEMVKRARSYILEQIDGFRTGCLKNGTV